jgi:hypothetical protein
MPRTECFRQPARDSAWLDPGDGWEAKSDIHAFTTVSLCSQNRYRRPDRAQASP